MSLSTCFRRFHRAAVLGGTLCFVLAGAALAAAPTEVWVDDDWVGLAPGTTVWVGPDPHIIGTDAFATINEGVGAVAGSGTVHVLTGTYEENVIVTKPLLLDGAGEANTTVMPAVCAPNPPGGGSLPAGSSNVILIRADNVTVSHLTVNGDNPDLAGGLNIGGANVDARNGIVTDHVFGGPYAGFVVEHCTVKNVYYRAICASSTTGGVTIRYNTVRNAQGDAAGSNGIFLWTASGVVSYNNVAQCKHGISANYSKGVQVLFNTVWDTDYGIHTDNAGDGGGVADEIRGNQVLGSRPAGYGIWVFNTFNSTSVVENTVVNVDVGLCVAGRQTGTPTFARNTVDGQSKAGSTGVYVTTWLFGWGDADVAASFTNNEIRNNVDGIYVEETGSPTRTATPVFFNNSLSGNTNSCATKGVYTGVYPTWTWAVGGTTVDASGNWWGTNSASSIAGLMLGPTDYTPWLDVSDDQQPGTPGFQGSFVTLWVDDSSPQTGGSGPITEGLAMSTAGGAVNVCAGGYSENLTVNKALRINGPASAGLATVTVTGNVAFTGAGRLVLDVQDPSRDRLDIVGPLDLSAVGDTLEIAPGAVVSPASSPYTLVSCSGARTSEFDVHSGVPAGWAIQYVGAGPGEIRLVAGAGMPVVTGVLPDYGTTAGGTPVIISGSNFTGATDVKFGTTSVLTFNVDSDSAISTNTPLHTPAEWVSVTVTGPGGSGTLPHAFEYCTPPEFTTLPYAAPSPGVVNRTIVFTCGVSGGSPPVTVEWTFGDGETGTGEVTTHPYRRPKVYAVTVKATDNRGVWTQVAMTPPLIVRSVFGQFDPDSNTDIVWCDTATGNMYAWLMSGTTFLEQRPMGTENMALYDLLGTSDVNRDGKADLLLWYRSGGAVYVRIMDGTTPQGLYRLGGANGSIWRVIGGMDLNGDGTGDVLFRRVTDGVVWAWVLNPGTPPTVSAIARIGWANISGWDCATGVSDVNGDGQCDILWREIPSPYRAYYWLMMPGGSSVASLGYIAPETTNWVLRGAGDYWGDGLDDLLWRDQAAGQNKIWRMSGTTKVSDVALPPGGPGLMVGPK